MHAVSKAWRLYTYAPFALSLGMMILGVLAIPGELWMKGFFLHGAWSIWMGFGTAQQQPTGPAQNFMPFRWRSQETDAS